MNKLRKWWITHQSLPYALECIERLEKHRGFISPFFCGETAYPIRLEQNIIDIKKAKRKYRSLLKELNHE